VNHPYDPARVVAFDTETHLIRQGLLAPPLVVGSIASSLGARLLPKPGVLDTFLDLLESDRIITGANIAFDMLVMAVYAARERGLDILPRIFDKYARAQVFDTSIAEALHAVAKGTLGLDPRSMRPLQRYDRETGRSKNTNRYSLDITVQLVLGRDDAKAHDAWRMRYAELDLIPVEQWPPDARQYPVDDVVNTREVALAQISGGAAGPTGAEPHENLHDHAAQASKAFALHLAAAWGFVTDQESVAVLASAAEELQQKGLDEFLAAGFLRENPKTASGLSEVTSVVKARVARAYGCTQPCRVCAGRGRVDTKFSRRDGRPVGKGKACGPCNGTGLELDEAAVPTTDPTETALEKDSDARGNVKAGRDVLIESGDEQLMAYGHWKQDAKILTTYVPFLEQGASGPITLSPNPVLATGRVSYDGVVQLLPRFVSAELREELKRRGARVRGVRDCIVARPGKVFYSVDYSGGELVTFAESAVNRVGKSDMGLVLIAGQDVHGKLAAGLAGLTYDEFVKRKKEPKLKALRQASKPVNFGCPGGIGAPKIVLQQRQQGPDTPCPSGPVVVWDDDVGDFVPGYKGLRFCVLVDGAERCGAEIVTRWGSEKWARDIAPTCRRCLMVAEEIRSQWFATWTEARPYLDWHAKNSDDYGFVVQHYSHRKRGGVGFCDAANGDFQALLADITGRAQVRVSQEQYCDPTSPLYGSRSIVFQHDELLGECDVDHGHEVAARVEAIMLDAFREGCPIHAAACRAEPTIMARWWKEAAPVWVGEGEARRLVEWFPA
jgi:hypothetical protein